MKKKIAIITGASVGIGKEFARQLDVERYDELWLIARRKHLLDELSTSLKTPTRIFVVDLFIPDQIELFARAINDADVRVGCLVNNAGFGKVGNFRDLDRMNQLAIIDLNIRALTHLSHAVIPYMERGSILIQLASSAGFAPLGGFAVYAASKAYVISFSMALTSELRCQGIHSIAVCPGSVKSEFSSISRGGTGWEKARFNRKADPAPVVRKALADARRRRSLSVYGTGIQLMHAITRLLPHQMISDFSARFLYRKPQERCRP